MESQISLLKMMTMDEADLNIWTLRFTITKDYINLQDLSTNIKLDTPIQTYLENLNKTLFPKIICYRETSKGNKMHYHIRIGTSIWKQRKSLFDSIHKAFPFAKGNKIFSTKIVRLNGVTKSHLEKSLTYIAKEHNHIFSRGYSAEVLYKIQTIGSQWEDESKLPIYKKIILRHSLCEKSTGNNVVHSVLAFYKNEGRDYPTYFALTKILSNIKLELDAGYRLKYLMRGSRFYDNMEYELMN